MSNARTSGILLHPTSLPGRWGIGDLGEAAYRFVDFLHASGQKRWQVMPLGPTGYGDSPYQSFSAFAGNPLLISPDLLRAEGLLTDSDLANTPTFPDHAVDYGAVIPFKLDLLRRAFDHFRTNATPNMRQAFNDFQVQNLSWLNDYALFAALKDAHGGAGWNTWATELAHHTPAALEQASHDLAEPLQFHTFVQFLFNRQWQHLKAYANERDILTIGDIPIFVAYDSADVWANPDIFALDAAGNPTVVAGVPPDYFSATGQRWGNPLYRWDVLHKRGYDWWIERFRGAFALYDIVRLDHFRGFAAYWEVPASEETAVNGRWVAGPNAALFDATRAALGELPIIAEDLGVITPDVEALRDEQNFPGMRVLQFAWSGKPDDMYLPHNYLPHTVVYTGTHDNDTTRGWWYTTSDSDRRNAQLYMGRDGSDIAWDFIRLALASVAETAIIPLQDVLDLGSDVRMNTPGQAVGNWSWRFTLDMLGQPVMERLHTLTAMYNRLDQPATHE